MDVLALVVGELTAYLNVNNDDMKRGVAEGKRDLNSLAAEAKRAGDRTAADSSRMATTVAKAMTDATRDADRKGRDAGGKLAQGINQGLIRNSPLIVAGVSAALAAGAPAVLAGATGMFAGIGIVAAAQSEKVRKAWSDTWSDIRAGAIADSAPIQNVMVRLADTVGTAFERMRPALRGIFEDVAPQMEVFTDGLLGMAQNALPGFQRAIERGMPVTQGFASFLESTGTGLTRFLDAMSSHSPAAGAAFSSLGDIMADLLPIVGELLGQGAELARVVLPIVSSGLGLVLTAAQALGPALTPVVAGFMAMKSFGAIAGILATIGGALDGVVTKWGSGTEASSRFTGAAKSAATALGPLGVAVGFVGAALADHQQDVKKWADGLLEGGSAAASVRTEIENMGAWDRFTTSLSNATSGMNAEKEATRDAEGEYRKLLAAMDPVNRAKALLNQATNDLSAALQGEGEYANDVAGAQRNYETAVRNSEAAQGALETAIHGVTQAMLDQANQALAAADSQFAYEQSVDSTQDSLVAYKDAVRDHGAASEEASDANRQLSQDMLAQAQAAGRAAAENSGLTDEFGRERVAAQSTLQELYRLRDTMGAQFPPALQNAITGLERSGAAMGGASAQAVIAQGTVENLIGRMGLLGQQRPNPTISADPNPLISSVQTALSWTGFVNQQRPTPVATLIDYVSAAARNAAAAINSIQSRTVYVTTIMRTLQSIGGGLFGATGGMVGRLGAVEKFAAGGHPGGQIRGPGTTTSDGVGPFATVRGAAFLSDQEWIIRAAAANKQGFAKMAALNAGMADIVMRGDRRVRGFAGGGSPSAVNPTTGMGATNGTVINVDKVVLSGTVDFGDRQSLRKAAVVFRDELVSLERASS